MTDYAFFEGKVAFCKDWSKWCLGLSFYLVSEMLADLEIDSSLCSSNDDSWELYLTSESYLTTVDYSSILTALSDVILDDSSILLGGPEPGPAMNF